MLKKLSNLELTNMIEEFLTKVEKEFSIELIASHPENLNNEITKSFYDEVFSTGKVLR